MASSSWCQAPIWVPRPEFSVRDLWVCWHVALSLMRGRICRLQLLLDFASIIILGTQSCGTLDQILLSQIWDSPNLVGQVPVFISPRKKVAQLYPPALGSIFVASYDSQGYSGGIWTRLQEEESVINCKLVIVKQKILLVNCCCIFPRWHDPRTQKVFNTTTGHTVEFFSAFQC
jgi:hypothetical protein